MFSRHFICVTFEVKTIIQRTFCDFKPKLSYFSDGFQPRAIKSQKPRAQSHADRKFVDFKEVHVIGGRGGNGCLSFLQLPQNEWAGPDGGDGGNGGHVILEASRNVKSLGYLKSIIRGVDGSNGRNKNCHGKNAKHISIKGYLKDNFYQKKPQTIPKLKRSIRAKMQTVPRKEFVRVIDNYAHHIQVPIGSIVRDADQTIIANLKKDNHYFLAARGGSGGKGNRFFLTNEERAPTTVEEGARGEDRHILIELQTIAHVGLIGFPNAGKSTLLRALSRARPRVAAFPFTTLNPHIGMIEYDDYVQVAVADIPGLIEGAHRNRGLGFSFLRHIERCSCLLYVIDLSGHLCWTQLSALKFELEQYQKGLSERPHAIVANKIDLPWAEKNLELLKKEVDLPIYAISAKHHENIDPLLSHIRQLYEESYNELNKDCDDDDEIY